MNASVMADIIQAVAWFVVSGTLLTIAVYLGIAAVGFLMGDDGDV